MNDSCEMFPWAQVMLEYLNKARSQSVQLHRLQKPGGFLDERDLHLDPKGQDPRPRWQLAVVFDCETHAHIRQVT